MIKNYSFSTLTTLGFCLALFSISARSAAAEVPSQTAQASDEAPSALGTVNIQTASAEELQQLPGIGPAKAAAIVEFRERNPFRRTEDLMRVRGIGRSIFRNVRAMLSIAGPTTMTVRPPARRRATTEVPDEAN